MKKKNWVAISGQPLRLNLGCGNRKMDGFIGVDIVKADAADYVFDLGKAHWPVANDSVDEIKTWHFFEHLEPAGRINFMNEAHRVMKVGANMEVIVPHWNSMRAVQDPFHKWPPLAETSFLYFNQGWLKENLLTHYGITADFDFPYGYGLNIEVQGWNQERQMYAIKYLTNAVDDLIINLKKRDPTAPKS